MKVCQHCFSGAWKESPLHVIEPESLSPHTRRSKHVTYQPKKWPTCSRCMIVSLHPIDDQSTCHPWVEQLYLILTHLQNVLPPSQTNLRRESKASAQLLAVMELAIAIEHDGVEDTPPKLNVLNSTLTVGNSFTPSLSISEPYHCKHSMIIPV